MGEEETTFLPVNMLPPFLPRSCRVYYAPALAIWWVKIIVIFCFVAYSAVSFVGIYQVRFLSWAWAWTSEGLVLMVLVSSAEAGFWRGWGQLLS